MTADKIGYKTTKNVTRDNEGHFNDNKRLNLSDISNSYRRIYTPNNRTPKHMKPELIKGREK